MHSQWSSHNNILIVRPDNMGDVLMSTPAIHAFKQSFPASKLTLLTSQAGFAAAPILADIDDYIVFDLPWVANENAITVHGINTLISDLKKKQFDAAIIFTVYSQSPLPTAMLCYQAGIKHIAAYCRENPYALISHWIPDREPLYEIQHQVIRDINLVKSIGARSRDTKLRISIPEYAQSEIHRFLVEHDIDTTKPWLVMHPGVSEKRRQYPIEQFALVGRLLKEKLNFQLVLSGTKSEKKLLKTMAGVIGSPVAIADNLSMELFAALIKQTNCLIANNTGPVHIAAAAQTPVVVLYALTNPQHLPWKTPYRALLFDVPEEKKSNNILLQYTYDRYFKKIHTPTPEMIVQAVQNLLKGKSDVQKQVIEL